MTTETINPTETIQEIGQMVVEAKQRNEDHVLYKLKRSCPEFPVIIDGLKEMGYTVETLDVHRHISSGRTAIVTTNIYVSWGESTGYLNGVQEAIKKRISDYVGTGLYIDEMILLVKAWNNGSDPVETLEAMNKIRLDYKCGDVPTCGVGNEVPQMLSPTLKGQDYTYWFWLIAMMLTLILLKLL
jgi:hypothetical protein